MIEHWAKTRVLVIDEISFMSISDLKRLDIRLQKLLENRSLYGGMSIVFAGDFSQLEPIAASALPLYCSSFETRRLWHDAINCFLELKGKHRFKDDTEWGEILLRFREGRPTHQDIIEVNKRVVGRRTKIPKNIKYGTRMNKVRDRLGPAPGCPTFLRGITSGPN